MVINNRSYLKLYIIKVSNSLFLTNFLLIHTALKLYEKDRTIHLKFFQIFYLFNILFKRYIRKTSKVFVK